MRKLKWLRGIALTLAGILGVITFVAPAQEASAGTYGRFCWVAGYFHGIPIIQCVDIPILVKWDEWWGPQCPRCGLSIDFAVDPAGDPDYLTKINDRLGHGLLTLGNAATTQDPGLRAKLRLQALDEFTAAARYSGKATLSVKSVGVANPEKQTYEPQPIPWLTAGGLDVADGVGLLQRSFRDPDNAAKLRDAAVAQFDNAYEELATQKEIKG
jgi:hypothetical protein